MSQTYHQLVVKVRGIPDGVNQRRPVNTFVSAAWKDDATLHQAVDGLVSLMRKKGFEWSDIFDIGKLSFEIHTA